MMTRMSRVTALLALCGATALSMGHTYAWIEGVSNDDWSDGGNWITTCPPGGGGCPSGPPTTTSDTGLFPYQASIDWDCVLDFSSPEEIDELWIKDNVDFTSSGGSKTLEVETLTIDAGSAEVVITLTSSTTLIANE